MKTKYAISISVAVVISVVAVMMSPGRAGADTPHKFAHNVSDTVVPFLVLGEAAIAFAPENGKVAAVQTAKALIATDLGTMLLKRVTREKRPNSDSRASFPSLHASESFAMATSIAEYYPKYKWPAYAVAGAIGWSRVATRDHHWYDVVAGAALGHYTAKHFNKKKNVELTPAGIFLKW